MNVFECVPPTDAQAALECFRAMADAAPVMIWCSDTEKRSTYFNKGWLEFTGQSLEHDQGNGWAVVVHPEDVERCRTTYNEAFDARRGFEIECRARRHDGCYRWHLSRGRPILAQDGTFLGYVGSCIDITDRKRMEERREQLLVDGFLDSAVYWLTPDGHIASWNSGAERLKGYRACEIIGEHFSCFYCAEDVQRGMPEWLLRVAAAEGRAEDEGWRLRKGGARFWASVVMTALCDDAGQLRGFVKVTRDMTGPRQMTDSLQRLREQRDAEERKRLLDEERQNIAHDRHERVEQAFFAVGLAATNAIGLARASTVVRLPVVDSLVDALSQVNDLAATGADQLHAAMFALNHAEVVGRGLVPSLSRLVKEFRVRTGIDADIVLTASEKRLQTDVAEALYAAAREALANVERHSNASAVLLALHIGAWSVRLTIQDDGTGAVSGADSRTPSGLHRVAERVLRLNGSFSAGPNTEGGFLVRTYLPLSLSGG